MKPTRSTLATQLPSGVDPALEQVVQAFAQSIDQLVIGADLIQIARSFSSIVNGGKVGNLDAVWLTGVIKTANVATLFNHTLGRAPAAAIEALAPQGQGLALPVVSSPGSLAITKRLFTVNGTYTPTPGTTVAILEAVGGGGGGGGVGASNVPPQNLAGAGGGSGSYSRAIVTLAQIGVSQVVTIGAGGPAGIATGGGGAGFATSIGALCTANGGGGGSSTGVGAGVVPRGGGGGGAGVGDLAVAGHRGGNGYINTAATQIQPAGNGADSIYGQGGSGGSAGGGATDNGGDAFPFGSGGGGGSSANSAGTSNGGAGSAGMAFITEYSTAGAGSGSGGLQITQMTNGQITLVSGSSNRPFTLILF